MATEIIPSGPEGSGSLGGWGRQTDRLENNYKLFVLRHSEVTLKVLETAVWRDYAGTPEFFKKNTCISNQKVHVGTSRPWE